MSDLFQDPVSFGIEMLGVIDLVFFVVMDIIILLSGFVCNCRNL